MSAAINYKVQIAKNKCFWFVYEYELEEKMTIVQLCHTKDKAYDYMATLEADNNPENW